jgi:autotransporter-associated beta strand protein
MLLHGPSTFTGLVGVEDGVLDVNHVNAFGASPGIDLDSGGSITLRTTIFGKTLVANGTHQLTTETAGSLLNASGTSTLSWEGPILLETNLVVIGGDMALNGAISGPGGLDFRNIGTAQIGGSSGNTYTGSTLARAYLLEFNKPSGVVAFGGPLVVGGGAGGPYEARWMTNYQHVDANITLYPNGYVNLTNHSDDFYAVTFNGGQIDTGTGQMGIYGPLTVNATNVSATINGYVGLNSSAYPNNPFIVYDSPGVDCDLVVNASIIGSGILIKQGPGNLCLNGNNTYTGATFLQQGILSANTGTALGANGIGQGTTISDGGTLRVSNGVTFSEQLSLSGTGYNGMGALNASGAVTFNAATPAVNYFDLSSNTLVRVEGSTSTLILNTIISGVGPFTKGGPGRLITVGSYASTYSGNTVIGEGTMELNKPVDVASIPGNLVIGPQPVGGAQPVALFDQTGEMAGTLATVNAGSLLNLNGNNLTLSQLTLNDGGAVQTSIGSLIFSSGGQIQVGSQAMSGSHHSSSISGAVQIAPNDSLTFNVNKYSFFAPFDFNPELDVQASIYAGPEQVQFAPAHIFKEGLGTMRLSANNTYKGATIIDYGTLIAANATALGTTDNGTFVNNGASLALDGSVSIINEPLYLASSNSLALDSRNGSNTWSGTIALSQPTSLNVTAANGYLQVLNTISGTGGLTKSGPGTLQFWGYVANSYSGLTTVSGGVLEAGRVALTSVPGDVLVGDDSTSTTVATLRVIREQQVIPAANLNVRSSGLLDVFPYPGVPVPVPAVHTLQGPGRVNLGTGTSLSISNDVLDVFSGVISGSGTLNKGSSGVLQLTGTNILTGTTYVYGGALQADGSLTTGLIEPAGGTLQGSGVVGAVTMVGTGSSLSPGPGLSPGILVCNNFDSSSSGGSFKVQLNGATPGTDYDQLDAKGTVTLGTALALNVTLGFNSSLSNTFTIIKNDGGNPISGIFSGHAQNSTVTVGTTRFRISYIGGSGHDVVLTQINGFLPEKLAIQQVGVGDVLMLWPTNDPAYTLQSNTSPTTTNWVAVTGPYPIVGTNYSVTNANATAAFYRLIK